MRGKKLSNRPTKKLGSGKARTIDPNTNNVQWQLANIFDRVNHMATVLQRLDAIEHQLRYLVDAENERREAQGRQTCGDEDLDDEDVTYPEEGELVQFQKFGNTIRGEVEKVGYGNNGLAVGVVCVRDRRGKLWSVTNEDLEPIPAPTKKKGRK